MESSWLETHWARPFHLALVFCLALGLLQAIKLYLQRQRLLRDLRPFPSPPTHWFYGHHKIFQDGKMEKLEDIIEKYPCAFPRWVGPFRAFFYIYDPDYAKTFLSRTDPKSKFLYEFMVPCLGKGLVTLNGPKWFQHRHLLTPGFHFNTLKSYVEVMAQSVNTVLGKWERICGSQDTLLEISEHISLMTLDILMKCIFSWETNCQINSTHDHYVKATREGTNILFYRAYNFFYHHDVIFKFSPKGHHLQEVNKILHQHTEKIIQDRKNSLKDENKQINTQKRKYRDFLDIVLSAQAGNGDSFSDTDLRSEVNTFMLAGHESVTGGICWLLYHLALYPEHQERCREEIRGILGDGSSITWDQLGEMSYTTMCIKESLRLAPPVLSFSRELSKPITFPDGRSLPAGMSVVLSIWGLHRNPAIWENPKVFDPLRFSQENNDKRHSHAYLPFSAGPRNCIGQHFAMAELKVAIALILLHFKVTPDPSRPLVSTPHCFLKPKNGVYLYLKKLP
ncbi:cytochrome P450 4X1 [Hippopotamus amphibius kiboko]|uniref:cytochrome P450 4X1 n=1 Tax=Hippopotamus amphibius kiboko TaxID=575201 RepID=UPI0025933C56|nr:cytochrome P450 4X1 [Hippopotamus amphibius kiboko]